jgi:hypothetical protein
MAYTKRAHMGGRRGLMLEIVVSLYFTVQKPTLVIVKPALSIHEHS